jgi:transcriptional regulator with XRE-family HTH domain
VPLTDRQRAALQKLGAAVATGRETQSSIASATGVSQSQISRILKGAVRRPSANVLKLCKFSEAMGAASRTAQQLTIDRSLMRALVAVGADTPAGASALKQLLLSIARLRRLSRG